MKVKCSVCGKEVREECMAVTADSRVCYSFYGDLEESYGPFKGGKYHICYACWLMSMGIRGPGTIPVPKRRSWAEIYQDVMSDKPEKTRKVWGRAFEDKVPAEAQPCRLCGSTKDMYMESITEDQAWEGVKVSRIGCLCDEAMGQADKDDARTTGYQPVADTVKEWNEMNKKEVL